MDYATLKAHAPSAVRVTISAVAALAVFTAAGALVGSGRAYALGHGDPYAVRIAASRTEGSDATRIEATVTENATQKTIASPSVTLDPTHNATFGATVSGVDVQFYARPQKDESILVAFTITKDGQLVQSDKLSISPNVKPANTAKDYRGTPITLRLKDAKLSDVLRMFSQLTGLQIKLQEGVDATISVNWVNVPWDQALDELVQENGLTWRLEENTMYINRK